MTAPVILSELRHLGIDIALAGENLKIRGRQELLTPDLIGQLGAAKPHVLNWLRLLDAAVPVPLTDMQLAYLIGRENALELGGVSSHVYHEFDGNWDHGRLQAALAQVVARHDALRMVIRPDGARVLPAHAITVSIPCVDLGWMETDVQQAALAQTRCSMSHQVMDAERGMLVDVRLSRLGTDRMRMHVSHDGLVIDGISMLILFHDLGRAYLHPDQPLTPLSSSFSGQLELLDAARESGQALAARRYWSEAGPALPGAPQLPLAADPASLGTPRSERHVVHVARPHWEAFVSTARAKGLSAAAGLGAGFSEVLSCWCSGEDFSLNMTLAHRIPVAADVFDVIGNFTQPCPVPFRHLAQSSVGTRAHAFAAALRAGIEHRALSGVEVLQKYGQRGQPALRLPVTLNCAFGAPGAPGAESLRHAFDAFGTRVHAISQTPQVWLNVFTFDTPQGLAIECDAVAGLFPDGMVADIAAALGCALTALAAPDAWDQPALALLPAATVATRDAKNDTASATATASASTHAVPARLLHDGFLEHACQTPHAVAIVAPELVIDYGTLLGTAAAIAGWLREQGLEHDQPVAVIMHKGWEQIAAALGIIMAGGCYLPIDAEFPSERVTQILALAAPVAVLTQAAGLPPCLAGACTLPVCAVRAGMGADPAPYLAENRPTQAQDTLAYVLFTSGSTGTPKGVMIEHRSALNLVADINARFNILPGDRVFGISAFHFDLSVFDIFGTLDAGATLILPAPDEIRTPDSLSARAAGNGVTVWNSVPALAQMLLESEAGLPSSLRLIIMSGDKIPAWLPAALVRARPGVQVIAAGGPTETTVWNILNDVSALPADAALVPYGFPTRNNRYHVLDQHGRVCPDWVTGQLHAAGSGLARGYWRDDARTAQAFFFHTRLGERLYATGDLGRVRPDGCIEILGRADFQAKINGNRIELGEIEFVLVQQPQIEAAVACVADTPAGQALTAFIVASTGHSIDLNALRDRLAQRLPAYMVPQIFHMLARLPLTANAKVDRKALTAVRVAAAQVTQAAQRAPAGNMETALAAIWERVLNMPVTDVHLRYEHLGGSSLSAVRIATEINRQFGVRLPVRDLDQLSTVAAQASYLDQQAMASS